jgi:hypothetical protein
MGETRHQPCLRSCHQCLREEVQGSRVTSDGGLGLVRELDERLGLTGLIQKHRVDSRTGRHTPFPLADRFRQSVDSRLSCGTEGAARALSGATGSTPKENFCWHDSKRGQVVSTHTKPGDPQGNPSVIARDLWSGISEDGRLEIDKQSAR